MRNEEGSNGYNTCLDSKRPWVRIPANPRLFSLVKRHNNHCHREYACLLQDWADPYCFGSYFPFPCMPLFPLSSDGHLESESGLEDQLQQVKIQWGFMVQWLRHLPRQQETLGSNPGESPTFFTCQKSTIIMALFTMGNIQKKMLYIS